MFYNESSPESMNIAIFANFSLAVLSHSSECCKCRYNMVCRLLFISTEDNRFFISFPLKICHVFKMEKIIEEMARAKIISYPPSTTTNAHKPFQYVVFLKCAITLHLPQLSLPSHLFNRIGFRMYIILYQQSVPKLIVNIFWPQTNWLHYVIIIHTT